MKADRTAILRAAVLGLALVTSARAEAPLRYEAPVTVVQPAPFIELPLPVAVFAHSRQYALADLRLLDARGERVPFAMLPPLDDQLQAREERVPVPMYAWPPSAVATLPPGIELKVDGGRIQLRQRAGSVAPPRSAGWLFDLGEADPKRAPPQALRLRWPEGATFSTEYRIDTSADLRLWLRLGGGQLAALPAAASAPALTQPLVPLMATSQSPRRFVRLSLDDAAQAPALTGAEAVYESTATIVRNPPLHLTLAAQPAASTARTADKDAARAALLDLGGELTLVSLDLEPGPGQRVLPLRVQARSRDAEPWREAGQGVVYRIERDGEVQRSPALALHGSGRWLRLVPDERAAALDPASLKVSVAVRRASLVFVAQGTPPYRLQVGSADAPTGALPVAEVVPRLEDERPRLGRAEVGAFTERPEAAQAAQREALWARWRPVLLWAVLGSGVAALGFMVWRLARARPA